MRIEVKFFTPNKKEFGREPERMIFIGNYAIETMIIKIAEKYFGKGISDKIEMLLKNRIE